MFSGVFESSKHVVSHARNTSPRYQPLMRLLFHVSRGRHLRLNCWCRTAASRPAAISFFGSKIRGQNTYMSAGSLVSLSSRYFTALAAMHDAQTQGKAPRARRRPPLKGPGTIFCQGHGLAFYLAEMQRSVVTALLLFRLRLVI